MDFKYFLIVLLIVNAFCAFLYFLGRGKMTKAYFPGALSVFYFWMLCMVLVQGLLNMVFWQRIVAAVLLPLPCFAILPILGRDKLKEAYGAVPQLEHDLRITKQHLEDVERELSEYKSRCYDPENELQKLKDKYHVD